MNIFKKIINYSNSKKDQKYNYYNVQLSHQFEDKGELIGLLSEIKVIAKNLNDAKIIAIKLINQYNLDLGSSFQLKIFGF